MPTRKKVFKTGDMIMFSLRPKMVFIVEFDFDSDLDMWVLAQSTTQHYGFHPDNVTKVGRV